MLPSLIEIYNQIDNRGFDIVPHKTKEGYIVLVWLNGDFLKKGKDVYKTWKECMDTTYINLYKHLNKIT